MVFILDKTSVCNCNVFSHHHKSGTCATCTAGIGGGACGLFGVAGFVMVILWLLSLDSNFLVPVTNNPIFWGPHCWLWMCLEPAWRLRLEWLFLPKWFSDKTIRHVSLHQNAALGTCATCTAGAAGAASAAGAAGAAGGGLWTSSSAGALCALVCASRTLSSSMVCRFVKIRNGRPWQTRFVSQWERLGFGTDAFPRSSQWRHHSHKYHSII